jgi:hypothetical protein
MMLIWLNIVEVITFSNSEPILTIELDVTRVNGVDSSINVEAIVKGHVYIDEESREEVVEGEG